MVINSFKLRLAKSSSHNGRLLFKVFFEASSIVISSFIVVYFANVLKFEKLQILVLLSVIPFFSRLVRPFVYYYFRSRVNLFFLNNISLVCMLLGLLVLYVMHGFWQNVLGLAAMSLGQGLYRMTLRRDLAEKRNQSDPMALAGLSKFFLSHVLAPVMAYPIGFYFLNYWPNGGVIFVAMAFLIPVFIPAITSKNGPIESLHKQAVEWNKIFDKNLLGMAALTFILVCLCSSYMFCAPFILYKSGTTIPIYEIVLMSVSGVFGIGLGLKKSIQGFQRIVLGSLAFFISPLLFLLDYKYPGLYLAGLAIFTMGFATGFMYPYLLAIPNHDKWGGTIESRFFVHSIFMALGAGLNVVIAVASFYKMNDVTSIQSGLVLLSIMAFVAVVFAKKLKV